MVNSRNVRFLLDADLSQRIARFLVERFALDVTSLQGQRLGQLPDHEVIKLARRERRVIITLDRDFPEWLRGSPQSPIGVIHLDLPSCLRYVPTINQILSDFFTHHVTTIDVAQSLVVLREDGFAVHRFEVDETSS